jgi:hypothetical protein
MEGADLLFPKPLAVANVPYGYLHRTRTKNLLFDSESAVYFLGDQFAVIPSFTGDGIAVALLSGKWAARSVDLKKGYEGYHHGLKTALSPRIDFGTFLHQCLRLPFLSDIFVWAVNRVPGLGLKIYESTRCPRIHL